MLWVSSLRRMVHSTSFRATGSLIVFWSSTACGVFPLRAAVIASLNAAMSAPEATAIRATEACAGWDDGCEAAVVPDGAAAFAGALCGRGFGSGGAAAGCIANAMPSAPITESTLENRVDG